MASQNKYLFMSLGSNGVPCLTNTKFAWNVKDAIRWHMKWGYEAGNPSDEEKQETYDWYGLGGSSVEMAGNKKDFIVEMNPGGTVIGTYGYVAMDVPEETWRERYGEGGHVKITDLGLGQEGTYSDYEELAFSDTDIYVYERVRYHVAQMCYADYLDGVDKKDICDTVFFNVAHIMMWWTGNTQNIMTDDMIRLAVETSMYMLTDTLNTGWLTRSGFDWAEEKKWAEGHNEPILPDHIPDKIRAIWYDRAELRDPKDKWGTDEIELTYELTGRQVIATYGSELEEEEESEQG